MAQTKRATIYLEPILHRALRVKAAETDVSVSRLVNDAVRLRLAEDAEDLEAFRTRASEPTSPFENLVSDLKRRGKLQARGQALGGQGNRRSYRRPSQGRLSARGCEDSTSRERSATTWLRKAQRCGQVPNSPGRPPRSLRDRRFDEIRDHCEGRQSQRNLRLSVSVRTYAPTGPRRVRSTSSASRSRSSDWCLPRGLRRTKP